MKKAVVLLALLVSASSVFAANDMILKDDSQWTCNSTNKFIQFDAKIYRRGDQYVAQLYIEESNPLKWEYDNDGDIEYDTTALADDVVVVRQEVSENGVAFRQVEGADPDQIMRLNVKKSGVTKGLEILIQSEEHKDNNHYGTIRAAVDPVGQVSKNSIACWKR